MEPETPDGFRVAIICGPLLKPVDILRLFDQRYDKKSSENGRQESDVSGQRRDESGSESGKQEANMNIYSGRIGRHHVVLAHMPDSDAYSATEVATKIRLRFKKVRLALVVDICGSEPLKRPIIPGDVIISDSIFELYTERHHSNRIQASSGLDNMLEEAESGIGDLLVRQDLEREIKRHLAKLCKKTDAARYPGTEQDKRLAASYRHMHRTETSPQKCLCTSARPNDDFACSETLETSCYMLECGTEASESTSCPLCFASGVPHPLVHVGAVGAATVVTVLKPVEHIDIVAVMDGVGVWDESRCVIIKGVCNDAHSQSFEEWQGYAAATAASAAKAILDNWTEGSSWKRSLSLGDEDDERPFRRQKSLAKPQSTQSHTQSASSHPCSEYGRPSTFLEDLDFGQRDARHATIKTAHAATCDWLLSRPEFRDWKDEGKHLEHHGLFWIKGEPGAGKSTIMKFAAETIAKNSAADHAAGNAANIARGSTVISFFFNATGEILEKSTCGMYRSLLFELLSKIPRLQALLRPSDTPHLQDTSSDLWTTEMLQSLFHRAIEGLEDEHLMCFVDALDECENDEAQVRKIVDYFKELGQYAAERRIRFLVCFSSRYSPDITLDRAVQLTLEDQEDHLEDIAKYVNSELKIGSGKPVQRIKLDICKNSQGIFLWVVLVVTILQETYSHGNNHGQARTLDERLKKIPMNLDGLFGDILGRDAQSKQNLALCLRWILYADRPLRPKELYAAILSASETVPLSVRIPKDVTSENIERFILNSSRNLAGPTASRNPTILFIHKAVKDFLLKASGVAMLQMDSGCTSVGAVHNLLKSSCQRYIDSIPADYDLKKTGRYETQREFPLLNYAVHHVLKHAELAASHGFSQESFLEHFQLEKWISLHDYIEIYSVYTEASLLYVLTRENLLHLFRVELRRSDSVNTFGGDCGYPIIAAAVTGNNEILESLLENGANPDARCWSHQHALLAAIDRSNVRAVKILLAKGAMSDLKSWTTLHSSEVETFTALIVKAVEKGQLSTLELILQNRASLTGTVPSYKVYSAITRSAGEPRDGEIFRVLIKSGVIRPDNGLSHALLVTMLHGLDDITRMMLDEFADYRIDRDTYDSILQDAVNLNNEMIVRVLLEQHGVNVNTSGRFGSTVLRTASVSGYANIARMLLEHDADVKAGRPLCAVLLFASSAACEIMVPMLLKYGADPNQPLISSSGYSLPLHTALSRGLADIVKLLLDHGADVNKPSSRYANASSALDSCENEDKRAACKALLPNASIMQSSVEIESGDAEKHTAPNASCLQDSMVRAPVKAGSSHREKRTARTALLPKENRVRSPVKTRSRQKAMQGSIEFPIILDP